MNGIKLKYKFLPGLLEDGFFPLTFDILKNSKISVQYVYFAMFALWNEFEFLKHKELIEYSFEGKPISDETVKKLIKGERSISDKFNPLIVQLGEIIKEKEDYLKESKIKVVVENHEITLYTFKPGEGLYIPFSDEIFSWLGIKDEVFCNFYHIGRSSLSSAREKLKEFELIDYKSDSFQGQKMISFTFIQPIKKWMIVPLKIFYLKELSRSSKVILFWINKYSKEISREKYNRKNFMEFSGFINEKTLRKLRRELIPLFSPSEDLLNTIL